MTPRQILSDARSYLMDPKHWIQRGFSDGYGGVCAVGAINLGSRGVLSGLILDLTPDYCNENKDARKNATDYLRRVLGIATDDWSLMFMDIPLWNDAKDRTHAEVIAAFDAAILLAAKDEAEQYVVVALPEGVELEPLPDYAEELTCAAETNQAELVCV